MATPNTPMLLSGRVPVTPLDQLSEARHQFLSLREAEPNLGNGVANSILTIQSNGNRVWASTLTLTTANFSGNVNANYFVGNFIGNVTAPGSNTQVIFNDGGILAGNGSLTFDKTTSTVTAANISYTGRITGTEVRIGDFTGNVSQGTYGIAIGYNAGRNSQSQYAIAQGFQAGFSGQGNFAVALGAGAGFSNQGNYAVAIGYNSGATSQANNSIAINCN